MDIKDNIKTSRAYNFGTCPNCGRRSIIEASNSFGGVKYCLGNRDEKCDYIEEWAYNDVVIKDKEEIGEKIC